jgi:hypothetical protein
LSNPRRNAAAHAAGGDFGDWNHAYHPRRMPALTSRDGHAVRDSRGQFVTRRDHIDYHETYEGPVLPRTADERFRAIVFCAAGYVPRKAMDFSDGSDPIVTLSDVQIHRLQTSGEIRMMQTASVRKFLHDYVLEKPKTDHIPRSLKDEFVRLGGAGEPENAYDRRRLKFLAHKLLLLVIDPATEPLQTAYRQGRQDRLWRPDAYVSPRHVVQEQLLGTGQYSRPQNTRKIGMLLCATLSKQREGELAAA